MESAHFTTAMGGFLLLAMQVNTILLATEFLWVNPLCISRKVLPSLRAAV